MGIELVSLGVLGKLGGGFGEEVVGGSWQYTLSGLASLLSSQDSGPGDQAARETQPTGAFPVPYLQPVQEAPHAPCLLQASSLQPPSPQSGLRMPASPTYAGLSVFQRFLTSCVPQQEGESKWFSTGDI